jgi:hypothetical protein
VISGTLDFPLHVCIDCFGANPANCLDGVTAAPSDHGPCCAPQDFSETCASCGGTGQPCCALPDGVPLTCGQDSDCFAFGLGLTPPGGGTPVTGDCFIPAGATSGNCICQGNADCQTFFGASSVCNQGVCEPGCNTDPTGKALVCVPQTSLPEGLEACGYLNTSALTSVCGTSS